MSLRMSAIGRRIRGEHNTDKESVVSDFHAYLFRKVLFIVACIVVAIVVAGNSLTIGSYETTFFETYRTIWNHITGNIEDVVADHIIIKIRLPIILEGLIAGASLSVAGAVMQSTMKNPLADSYTTGISSGASMGAALAIIYGFTIVSGPFGIVVNAFIFSLIPAAVIILVSMMKGASPTTMILAGLAVMYIFNAFTTVMMLWADPEDTAAVYQWQVGTISNASADNIPLMFGVCAASVVILQWLSAKINVLSSGDENARSLGVDAYKLRIACLIIVSLMTASVVSFTGVIGFVGLVCPHIARIFIGSDNRYLIPASAAFGAAFLLFADYVGRVIVAPYSLQVGVLTAFIGGPMFLALIMAQRRETF